MGAFKTAFLMKSPLNAYADGKDGRQVRSTADLYNNMLGKIADATNSIVDARKSKSTEEDDENQAFDNMMASNKVPEENELNPEDLDIEEVEEDIDISIAYDKDGNEIQTGLTN